MELNKELIFNYFLILSVASIANDRQNIRLTMLLDKTVKHNLWNEI